MANQELAEVHRDASVHEVEEDQVVGAVLLDADRQLVGKAADDRAGVRCRTRCAGSPPGAGSCRASSAKNRRLSGSGLSHQQRRSPSTASRIITRSTMRPTVAAVDSGCRPGRSPRRAACGGRGSSRPRRTGPGSMARANPRATRRPTNSRLFWPRTVPVNAQYCRSRKQPEWTITVTRNSRCRSREAEARRVPSRAPR